MMKEFISWSKNLLIGIKDIDNQHKKFISLINKAHEVHNKKDKELMKDLLDELIEYARIHFTTEEEYFKKWNYPYAKEHMKEHEKVTLKVLKFHDKFENNECDCDEFLNFLKEWLENHLMTYDFKYRDYIKEKGFI